MSEARRVSHCRSCGADIVWLPTASGKSMPVDASTVDDEDEHYEHSKHVSHFATCPSADWWRKP